MDVLALDSTLGCYILLPDNVLWWDWHEIFRTEDHLRALCFCEEDLVLRFLSENDSMVISLKGWTPILNYPELFAW